MTLRLRHLPRADQISIFLFRFRKSLRLGIFAAGHQFWRAIHGFLANGTGTGRPFAVLVEKKLPEALLHPALLAIGAGEGFRPALQI